MSLDATDAMPLPCVVNLGTPELVPKAILVERITRLGDARMMDVCRAIATVSNC